ncbi:diaminopimelate dehydrogenase [Candidatus Pacearchaeota archaeon]|nr:diaminopimelate dehydrogenase [Candidatus Pacearchaeota archaeon]
MEQPIRIAIVGWGNVGRGVYEAIQKNPDTRLVGILTRDPARTITDVRARRCNINPSSIRDAASWREVEILKMAVSPDVAILCTGSATDLPEQGPKFAQCFNTIDSFDTHADIPNYLAQMDSAAKSYNHLAVCCAGWDPGTFSIERIMALSFIPEGKPYTFWGPGVSQGHSDAIRRVPGVKDGIQYTLPINAALEQVRAGTNPDLTTRQKHSRDCYVTLEPGADPEKVRTAIVTMPKYFEDYDTRVTIETPEQITERKRAMPHGGFVMVSGETGKGNKALIEYKNQWASNPEATGSILVACARANYRMRQDGRTGAITMADIPPVMYHPLERAEVIKNLM